MLNSGVTGYCFDPKLRKSSEDLFLVATKENWGPSQICAALCEDPTVRALQKSATTGCLMVYKKNLEFFSVLVCTAMKSTGTSSKDEMLTESMHFNPYFSRIYSTAN